MKSITMQIVFSGWANWYAIDEDGRVYEYEFEPNNQSIDYWSTDHDADNADMVARVAPPSNWRTELHRIER